MEATSQTKCKMYIIRLVPLLAMYIPRRYFSPPSLALTYATHPLSSSLLVCSVRVACCTTSIVIYMLKQAYAWRKYKRHAIALGYIAMIIKC